MRNPVSHPDVLVEITIVVSDGHTHRAASVRGPRVLGHVLECAVAPVDEKRVRRDVVGDVSDHDRVIFEAITAEMPLRNMITNSQGKLNQKLMSRLIHCMNHDWMKLIKGTPANSE